MRMVVGISEEQARVTLAAMQIAPLAHKALPEARDLLARSLPFDRIAHVAEEKLFGSNGSRSGATLAAIEGDELVGLVAVAGRWVKLLVVAPEHRRRGIGSSLLEAARPLAGGKKMRLFDHPGNYLSPGIDVRYLDAPEFLSRRGFRPLDEVENIRAPLEHNPLVTDERARELAAKAALQGYTIRRATDEDDALLVFVERGFAPVWAHEVRRALAGPRRAVHVALTGAQPVAFAAADGNNQGLGWFGPAGTDPAHRGRGLGEALLIPTLLDVRGLPEAGVIAWIGPKAFYAKSCGAVDDRRFRAWEES
jgi:GNAT superfamily N-acetyltransferase